MSGVFLARRLLLAIPTLLGVVLIVFVLMRVVPGDPIAMMTGLNATPADIERLRALHGFDQSIFTQFVFYLENILQGDFGTSITRRQPVADLVLSRLPATLELSVAAMIFAIIIGVFLATAATLWRGRVAERMADGFSALGLAIPDFLWGLIFILVLGVMLPILPISGRIDPRLGFEGKSGLYLVESFFTGQFAAFLSVAEHMILPAAALALPLAAIIARVLKSSLPTVTLTAVQFTFLVGGTVLVERIFGYPGLGNMAIEAVVNRDLPLIQGIVITFAVIFIALNIAIDMTYALLDPRLRHG